MIIKIQLKDPDGIYDAIGDAVDNSFSDSNLSSKERDLLRDSRRDDISAELDIWIECGEYVTIQIDTTNNTATVLPRKSCG